jgi:hypothetical protein
MNNALQNTRQSFCVLFIRMHGPEIDPTVRVLLIETSRANTVYEGFGSWSQCERWVAKISGREIPRDQLSLVQKRLELKHLATIEELQASLVDLDSVGLSRADVWLS